MASLRAQVLRTTSLKIHSATSARTGKPNNFLPALRHETIVLAAGVGSAFVFVAACIFLLG